MPETQWFLLVVNTLFLLSCPVRWTRYVFSFTCGLLVSQLMCYYLYSEPLLERQIYFFKKEHVVLQLPDEIE